MFTIAERIKQALEIRGMKQADLVSRTGIGKSSISTYISGDYEPKQRNIYKIAEALDVSPSWLMGYDVPMKATAEQPSNTFDPFSIPGIMPLPKMVKKPRLGTISCGIPIASEENFDGYDDVPEKMHCDFTLKCEGDSMVGARILDGDIVYIRQQTTIESGQIAAVLIDDTEKLLKRVYIKSNSIVLQAENPKYEPRFFVGDEMNSVKIIGLAVGFTSIVK